MDINTLIETITESIAEQSDITTWSTVQYGHGYQVFENVDLRNPPEEDQCPMVVISPSAKVTGLVPQKTHVVGADVLVYDARKTEQDNGVVRFEGGRQAEILRKLVLAKIVAAAPSNLKLDTVAVEYDSIAQFPYVFVDMELTFTEEVVIGGNPYE